MSCHIAHMIFLLYMVLGTCGYVYIFKFLLGILPSAKQCKGFVGHCTMSPSLIYSNTNLVK